MNIQISTKPMQCTECKHTHCWSECQEDIVNLTTQCECKHMHCGSNSCKETIKFQDTRQVCRQVTVSKPKYRKEPYEETEHYTEWVNKLTPVMRTVTRYKSVSRSHPVQHYNAFSKSFTTHYTTTLSSEPYQTQEPAMEYRPVPEYKTRKVKKFNKIEDGYESVVEDQYVDEPFTNSKRCQCGSCTCGDCKKFIKCDCKACSCTRCVDRKKLIESLPKKITIKNMTFGQSGYGVSYTIYICDFDGKKSYLRYSDFVNIHSSKFICVGSSKKLIDLIKDWPIGWIWPINMFDTVIQERSDYIEQFLMAFIEHYRDVINNNDKYDEKYTDILAEILKSLITKPRPL